LYRRWEHVADGELLTQFRHLRPFIPVTGAPIVVVRINPTERGDCDNRIKAASDFLVSRGITLDDRHNWAATATKDPSVPRGFCIVQITKAEADAA
jgi:Holliday junction resolvase RusA-like endonuclease